MSAPLEPNKVALGATLRRRVEKYTADRGLGAEAPELDGPAADPQTADRLRSEAVSPNRPQAHPSAGVGPMSGGPAHGESPLDPKDDHEVYSIGAAFGGAAGLLDTGLPSIVFIVTYTASGSNLRLAIILAVTCGAVLAIVRLARRQSLQHAIGGFLGVALAAYIANRSGRPEDFYLPGLYINAGYALAYALSIVVRWPLLGLLVAAIQQKDLSSWRNDPVLLRAYSRASWLWVGMFLLRLAVQLPLYLASAEVPLGIARVAMGWPLFLLTAWLTYIVIKSSVPVGYRVRKVTRDADAATPAPPADVA